MKISRSHPRYESLKHRHLIVHGMEKGFVAKSGLIAHGRGEAFDYLLGEKTVKQALAAEKASVALMLSARRPVISVNGNTAALVPNEIVKLAKLVGAEVEVNLFYRTRKREKMIEAILKKAGAKHVLGVGRKADRRVPDLASERGKVDSRGIFPADVVLVPLEDGDRVEALVAMNKKIVSIDLNPLSRTSKKASIAIVDNVVRALPNMIELAEDMSSMSQEKLCGIARRFNNKKNLDRTTAIMRKGMI